MSTALAPFLNGALQPCGETVCAMLSVAALNDHADVLELLLAWDAGVQEYNSAWEIHDARHPLLRAARYGALRAVQCLVKFHKRTWDAGSVLAVLENAAGEAAAKGHVDVVQWLLKSKADTNGLPQIAVWGGFPDVLQTAISAKADVNLCDHNGTLPLVLAAAQGRTSMVELLLAAKADVHECDESQNHFALLAAARTNCLEVAKMLLRSKASVHQRSPGFGAMPVWKAVQSGHFRMLALLLRAKAELDVRKALSGSVAARHYGTVAWLLRNRPHIVTPATVEQQLARFHQPPIACVPELRAALPTNFRP
jgi:ankyrin repeat protein